MTLCASLFGTDYNSRKFTVSCNDVRVNKDFNYYTGNIDLILKWLKYLLWESGSTVVGNSYTG